MLVPVQPVLTGIRMWSVSRLGCGRLLTLETGLGTGMCACAAALCRCYMSKQHPDGCQDPCFTNNIVNIMNIITK